MQGVTGSVSCQRQTALSTRSHSNALSIVSGLVVMFLMLIFGCDIAYNRGVELMEAVKGGEIERAERLVKTGANLDLIDDQDRTALDVARSKGYEELVELMEVTRLDQRDTTGHTPLMRAIEAGDMRAAVGMMERRVDITVKDNAGRSAWDYALEYGATDVIRVALITHRDKISGRMLNAGLFTAAWDGHPEILNLLLEHDANPRRANGNGSGGYAINVVQAAFWGAVGSYERYVSFRADMVRALLAAGGSANGRSRQTTPPLGNAIYWGDLEMVEQLIERGANVNARFRDTNVVHYAIQAASWRGSSDRPIAEILRRLIEAGANFERRDEAGVTPLIASTRTWRPEIVEVLIAAGANLDAKAESYNPGAERWMRMTALEIAEVYGIDEVADALRTAALRIR